MKTVESMMKTADLNLDSSCDEIFEMEFAYNVTCATVDGTNGTAESFLCEKKPMWRRGLVG